MQRLARDTAEEVELREEVTQAQVAMVMVRAHAAQAEGWARRKLRCWRPPMMMRPE
jgi:hypothetical protein